MITTIAICATVVSRRESQKARNAAILNGSGTRLTGRALIGGGRSGNRLRLGFATEVQALDQPRHREALNQDRKSDDHEGGGDDRLPLGHCRWQGQRERERKRTPKPAPEQNVLIARGNPPAAAQEQRRERIDRE